MKKIIVLGICLLSLCGCHKSSDKMAENLASIIVDLNQVKEPSLAGLNKEEKELLNEYIESEKKDNKVISIDNSVYFSAESYTEEENTKGLYQEDGKYYIKYNDLKWKPTPNGDDYYAVINLDSYQSAVYKSLVPILYKDTHGKSKYNYDFGKKIKNDDKIKYFYKSIYDESGFVIVFNLKNNKIDKIETYYLDIYYEPEE